MIADKQYAILLFRGKEIGGLHFYHLITDEYKANKGNENEIL